MSKRKLLQLVEQKLVQRLGRPAHAHHRRASAVAAYTPEAIRDFIGKVGVAKNLSTVDVALLESCARDDLDRRSPRVMCVLRPLELDHRVVPRERGRGARGAVLAARLRGQRPTSPRRCAAVASCRSRGSSSSTADDFAEVPPTGWKRLAPGKQVRLRHGYIVTCTRVEKENGQITRVVCTHDPATRGGVAADGKRVDGTIHWVSAAHAKDVEVRIYDRLFTTENPGADESRDWLEELNPASLSVVQREGGAEPRSRRRPAIASSSSASASSMPIPIRSRARRSSIARCRSRTAGRSRRRRRRRARARPLRQCRRKRARRKKPASVAAPLTPAAQALVDDARAHRRRGAQHRPGARAPSPLRRRDGGRGREEARARQSRRCWSTISSARCARRSSTRFRSSATPSSSWCCSVKRERSRRSSRRT